jgi:hypothetical protein
VSVWRLCSTCCLFTKILLAAASGIVAANHGFHARYPICGAAAKFIRAPKLG